MFLPSETDFLDYLADLRPRVLRRLRRDRRRCWTGHRDRRGARPPAGREDC